MALTNWQITEALGRAALVYELIEVEDRAARMAKAVASIESKINVAEGRGPQGREEADDLTKLREEREGDAERLRARVVAIAEQLWGEDAAAGEESWRELVGTLDRERALLVVEQVLRRRPEVTPPEDVDAMTLDEIRSWLEAKIGELPKEERSAWLTNG